MVSHRPKIDQKALDFLISPGPFFVTPIEDSRSHHQKPMGFLRCERESSIGVAKKGPAERQNLAWEVKIHWVFNILTFFWPKIDQKSMQNRTWMGPGRHLGPGSQLDPKNLIRWTPGAGSLDPRGLPSWGPKRTGAPKLGAKMIQKSFKNRFPSQQFFQSLFWSILRPSWTDFWSILHPIWRGRRAISYCK